MKPYCYENDLDGLFLVLKKSPRLCSAHLGECIDQDLAEVQLSHKLAKVWNPVVLSDVDGFSLSLSFYPLLVNLLP